MNMNVSDEIRVVSACHDNNPARYLFYVHDLMAPVRQRDRLVVQTRHGVACATAKSDEFKIVPEDYPLLKNAMGVGKKLKPVICNLRDTQIPELDFETKWKKSTGESLDDWDDDGEEDE